MNLQKTEKLNNVLNLIQFLVIPIHERIMEHHKDIKDIKVELVQELPIKISSSYWWKMYRLPNRPKYDYKFYTTHFFVVKNAEFYAYKRHN